MTQKAPEVSELRAYSTSHVIGTLRGVCVGVGGFNTHNKDLIRPI